MAKALRVMIGLILVVAAGLKLPGVEGGVWVSRSFLTIAGLAELVIGLGCLLSPGRWPLWGGVCIASGIIMITVLHLGDPRPCGCLGRLPAPIWLRLALAALIGSSCSLLLGKRPVDPPGNDLRCRAEATGPRRASRWR